MNVTYLLGAGASAGTNFLSQSRLPSGVIRRNTSVIPVVSAFTDELIHFLQELSKHNAGSRSDIMSPSKRLTLTQQLKGFVPDFCDDLRLHHSVDTLARKYFVKYGFDSRELRFLKYAVSSFLFVRQFEFGVDPRYDLFFSAIGDRCDQGGLSLPKSVSIVSWNYDNQLELSLNGFHDKGTYSDLRRKLNMFPQISRDKSSFNPDTFSILKLNGTCDMVKMLAEDEVGKNALDHTPNAQYDTAKMAVRFGKHRQWLHDCILAVFEDQFNAPIKHESLLSFSWEEEPCLSEIRANAKQIAMKTHVLVVIGYSFPTFNRRMDRAFIEGLVAGEKLQKVYIQVSDKDFVSVKSRLKALFPNDFDKIEQVPQLDEFYVPYELDLEVPKGPLPHGQYAIR